MNWRASRRQKDAEADKASAQADKETVLAMREAYNTMKDALAEVRASNDRINEVHEKDEQTIAAKNTENTALREENAAVREENASLKMMICKHAACPFKEPPIGKGREWYDTHKHDDMLTDTESIIVIGKRHGWYLKRLPGKSEEIKGNGDDK